MIVRFNASSTIRRPSSSRDRIGLLSYRRCIFRILLNLFSICIIVHWLATRSTFDGLFFFNDAFLGERHVDVTTTMYQNEERTFPRTTTYFQNDAELLTKWRISPRRVPLMGKGKSITKIAERDDLELDTVETDDCKLQYNWQKTSFPTCNSLHEFDGTKPLSRKLNQRRKLFRIIGNGFWRDVWIVNYEHGLGSQKGILKTMRYRHDYTPRNFDRMRRDSVAMERLTKSPFVLNLYSYCGTTSLSEFGDGGDIPDALWSLRSESNLSQIEKLRIGMYIEFAVVSVLFL
jgi:hypothetical protein